jgi:hypothetical protein
VCICVTLHPHPYAQKEAAVLFNTLLTLHIIAGFTALITAFVAILSKTMHAAHQWHVYSGHLYFWGMAVVFLTALPMSILHPNLFLFLIAIFSFSLALTGWRFAKNRRGAPQPLDWVQAAVMAVTSMVMILYGLYLLLSYNSNGISILVLVVISMLCSRADAAVQPIEKTWPLYEA